MIQSFDPYSSNYNELVDNVISRTGYHTNHFIIAKLQKLKDLFPSLSNKPFHLLDFGCGIGNLYENLLDYFPKAVYTGVDPSRKSILHARSRFSTDIIFQVSDSTEWRSFRYDLIFSSGVFHHVPGTDHERLIGELSTLLRGNGRLVIWEHNPLNPVTRKIVKDCCFDRGTVLVDPKDLRNHCYRASLTNIQVIYTTFFPRFLSSLNFFDRYLGWLPLGGQYLVISQKR